MPDSEHREAYTAWVEEVRAKDLKKEEGNYELKKSEIEGWGWYARRDFVRNEVISKYLVGRYEDIRIGDDIEEGSDFDHGAVQCGVTEKGDALYIGVPNSPRRFINHSCEPNVGISRHPRSEGGWDSFIIAICDIKTGDEIVLDYSTTQLEKWEMEGCRCGKENCRHTVTDFAHISPDLQEKYIKMGIIPDWMKDAIKNKDTEQ